MHLIIDLLINTVAIIVTAYVLPGVHVSDLIAAVITAVVLAIVNTFIRPVIVLITLPLTILTLGLFILIINSLLILLVSALVPGFKVDGFLWALLFSIVLWVVNAILHSVESRLVTA